MLCSQRQLPNQISYLVPGTTHTHTPSGSSDLIWWSAKVDSPVSFQIWISLRQNLIWVIELGGEVIAKNVPLLHLPSWKYYLCPDRLILQMPLPGKHFSSLRTILTVNRLTPSIVIGLKGLSVGSWKSHLGLFSTGFCLEAKKNYLS